MLSDISSFSFVCHLTHVCNTLLVPYHTVALILPAFFCTTYHCLLLFLFSYLGALILHYTAAAATLPEDCYCSAAFYSFAHPLFFFVLLCLLPRYLFLPPPPPIPASYAPLYFTVRILTCFAALRYVVDFTSIHICVCYIPWITFCLPPRLTTLPIHLLRASSYDYFHLSMLALHLRLYYHTVR